MKLVRHAKPKVALEIGTGRCGTAVLLGKEIPTVISVDLPPEEGDSPSECEREAKALLDNWTLIRGRSNDYETIHQVETALAHREVDLLFIDAEHTEQAAKSDYDIYRRFLSGHGMTAFHDICMLALWPMWNRLRGQRPPSRSVEIIRDIRQDCCGLGILLGK